MTQTELIKQAQSCGWIKLKAVNTGGDFIILRKGKYELRIEGDCCNVLENDRHYGIGRGIMYLSKAKTNPKPWIIGLFEPMGRWFSLKANRFLSDPGASAPGGF